MTEIKDRIWAWQRRRSMHGICLVCGPMGLMQCAARQKIHFLISHINQKYPALDRIQFQEHR